MVEHNDDFGSTEPEPAPRPEGDAGPDLTGLQADFGDPLAGQATHEAAFKHPHHAPEMNEEPPKHPVFPAILGGVMLLSLVTAWMLNKSEAPEPASNPTPTASGEAAAPTADPAAPAPAAEPKDHVAVAAAPPTAEIEGLKTELKALHDRLEAMPKAASSADVESLTAKVANLAKHDATLADLPKKLEDLDGRISGFDKTLTSLQGEFETFKADAKKTSEPGAAPASTAGKPEDSVLADTALEPAVGLFKGGKYKEASDAFLKLTASYPNDARAWYYAALSRGSSTKDWQGETARLAEKGVEREKAGTPDLAKIDASFADLNPNFNAWFGYYRKLAKAR